MANSKLELLLSRRGPILLDGAIGTELFKSGCPLDGSPAKWGWLHPEILYDLHKSYVKAGSEIIYAGSFGADEFHLGQYGDGDKVEIVNKELALIAKDAAGDAALVAGSIGPTSLLSLGLSESEVQKSVSRQVTGLLEGGVDLFVIETMTSLKEALLAVAAVKERAELPIVVTFALDKDDKTADKADCLEAVERAKSWGAAAVGFNCLTRFEQYENCVEKTINAVKIPILVKPNAGIPHDDRGRLAFPLSEKSFVIGLLECHRKGARLLGGCCGVGPAYIAALKQALLTPEFTTANSSRFEAKKLKK